MRFNSGLRWATSTSEGCFVMIGYRLLLASVVLAIPAALAAQDPEPATKEVEGATAEREALIAQCSAYKFESVVVLDPVKNRTTRVKLCSVPGASDAEWVKTLNAAIVQLEQRRMPGAAKVQLIEELRAEIAKFDSKAILARPAPTPAPSTAVAASTLPSLSTERFETSTLPSLEPRVSPLPAERFEVATLPSLDPARKSAGAAAAPARAMAFAVKCLEPGESGGGMTCDFLQKNTVLAIRAVNGLEDGGRLRFIRRGDERGEVELAAMEPGAVARIRLPAELCRGVKATKVELALLAPKATTVSARLGPYGLRC
jgi:hypothetical protein